MIFFCEDCGAKNDLGQADVKNGKAVFRCCSCRYMNSYTVPGAVSETNILVKKKIQSHPLLTHPEIIGTFLYHGKKGALTNHMPESLTRADLEVLGTYLSRSYLAGLSHYPDIHRVMIAISDKHITLEMLGPDLFFFVVSKSLPLPAAIEDLLISMGKKDNGNDFS